MLRRQREGLTGHLGEISAWLQKENNAWLSKDGKGEYGWEELPYWLKGYIELAYIFDDGKMIKESQTGSRASGEPAVQWGFWARPAIRGRHPRLLGQHDYALLPSILLRTLQRHTRARPDDEILQIPVECA